MSVQSRWLDGAPADSLMASVEREVTVRGGRLQIEVVDPGRRAAVVEVRFRVEFVEIWSGHHCCAILDRDALRDWVREGGTLLVVDEVGLSRDGAQNDRIRLSIAGIADGWTLSPADDQTLRERL